MLERDRLWDSQEMGTEGQERWPQVFCYRAGDDSKDWNWENRANIFLEIVLLLIPRDS